MAHGVYGKLSCAKNYKHTKLKAYSKPTQLPHSVQKDSDVQAECHYTDKNMTIPADSSVPSRSAQPGQATDGLSAVGHSVCLWQRSPDSHWSAHQRQCLDERADNMQRCNNIKRICIQRTCDSS